VFAPALSHAGLRREMEDVGAIGKRRGKVDVLDARLDEAEPLMGAGRLQVPLLDLARIVVGETVDADDVRAVAQQSLGERRSDESGCAGNESLHENNARTRSGSRQGLPARSSV